MVETAANKIESGTKKEDTAEKKRIAVLRQQMRDADKEIRQLQSINKRDEDMAEWKMISDLKEKFIKELKSNKILGRMSWKRFNNVPTYYNYALTNKNFTHQSVDDKADWIGKALKAGKTLEELQANADRMRMKRWERQEREARAAAKKIKDDEKIKSAAAIKNRKGANKKIDTNTGETDLEEHLTNG
jgi:hypothetical protein